MPKWKFLITRHLGNARQRQEMCSRIRTQVENHGFSNFFPMVKYERGRGKEYYLGLAIAGDTENESIVAHNAREILYGAGIHTARNPTVSPILDPRGNQGIQRQIDGLLRGAIDCDSFTQPITYEKVSVDDIASIKDRLQSESDISEFGRDAVEREKYARLLYWCSSVGSGGLDRIKQVCNLLGISSEWGGAWSMLRRLVLLGHLEFDGGATLKWCIIPPTFVSMEKDHSRKFLVGQRNPSLIKALSEMIPLKEIPQINGPSLFHTQGIVHGISYQDGHQIMDGDCVSGRMAELLPEIETWISRLPTWDENDFGRFAVENYDYQEDNFIPNQRIIGQPRPGLYRFTFEQRGHTIVTVAFYDDQGNRWICGDYYGLRFMARSRLKLCQAIHVRDTHQLVIPVADRWPMPYERALVLASGLLPQHVSSDSSPDVVVYDGITAKFAKKMCDLLGIEKGGQ